ncbi:MAG TPA: hypothetical protein DDW50_05320, partial [Firmicutes bacterium]|nr:hypothetical protein [Bacillota bacterium]
ESFLVQFGFVIFLLAGYLFVREAHDRSLFRQTIVFTVFLISIYGIFQYLFGDPVSKTIVGRVKSLLGDPNALGAFLILSIPLILVELKQYFQKLRGFWMAGCLFLAIIALFLSFSRSAWVGFLFGLIPWLVQSFIRYRQKAIRKLNYTLIILVLTIIITGFLTSQICTHFQPQQHKDYELDSRVSSITQGNDSGRALIWSAAWKSFKAAPIVGYGIGSFQVSFHRFQSVTALRFWGPDRDLRQVHNETLHYLATQGILGLFSYFGLLFSLFLGAKFSGLFGGKISFEKTALWSAIFGYLCYVQLNYPLIHHSFLFWIDLGILLGMAKPPAKPLALYSKNNRLLLTGIILLSLWSFFCINIFRADLHYYKAFNTTRFHRYEQPFSNYRKAILLTPWNFHYRYRYGISLYRAALWESKHQHPKLTAQYLKMAQITLLNLTKKNPDRYESLFLLGQVNMQIGNFKNAILEYRQALRLYPLNYKIDYSLAKALWLLGYRTESIKVFQAGLALNPSYMKEMLTQEKTTFSIRY